jgi:hypothetical protein
MVAFDLLELQGDDLRNEPLFNRKQRLARILSGGLDAIAYSEHVTFDGPTVFEHACRLGLEGIVAFGRALSQRAVEGLAEVEKSHERGGPARAEGGMELKHRGIEYTIVQGLSRQLWKWTVTIKGMTLRPSRD